MPIVGLLSQHLPRLAQWSALYSAITLKFGVKQGLHLLFSVNSIVGQSPVGRHPQHTNYCRWLRMCGRLLYRQFITKLYQSGTLLDCQLE